MCSSSDDLMTTITQIGIYRKVVAYPWYRPENLYRMIDVKIRSVFRSV